MRDNRSSGLVIRVLAVTSLAFAGVACVAQDVVYVDDFNQPPSQPEVAKQQASWYGARRGREASREQVTQALAITPQPQAKERKEGGPLSKLSSTFKGFFHRDETIDQVPNDPFVRQPSMTPGNAINRNRSGVQQAAYAAPQASNRNGTMRRGNRIQLRHGDQRVGLLDGMFSSQNSVQGKPSSSNKATNSTRKPTAWGKQDSVASAHPSTSTRKQPRPNSHKLTSRGASKPSDGVVMISDMDQLPAQRPRKASPPRSLPEADVVMVSDQGRLPSSVQQKAAPRMNVSAPIPNNPAPRPVSNSPAPAPLVIENTKAMASEPLARAATSPRVAEPQSPKPIVAVPKQPQVSQTPMPLPSAAMAPPKPVAVLPNPVEVAQQSQAKPVTERAAVLLAEAHSLAGAARTEDQLTRVVQQCRYVLAIDDSSLAVQYSNDLVAWALNKRGELKADEDRLAEAMADFDEAIRKDPGRWRAMHNRGVLLAQAGKFADAFECFNKTIELNPEFAKAYSNRASLYVQAGEFQTSLADYKKAISLDPDLVIAHKGRGRVCHVVGQLEQALRHFEAAVLLDPNDASIATCRADLLTDMGRYAQAIGGYQQAIKADPQLATAYRNLAWLLATCPDENYRDGRQALVNAQHAVQLSDGADDICLDTVAAAQAAIGDYAGAVKTIKQAISLAPAADQAEYSERLELYEAGRPFLSSPTGVQQASYNNTQIK